MMITSDTSHFILAPYYIDMTNLPYTHPIWHVSLHSISSLYRHTNLPYTDLHSLIHLRFSSLITLTIQTWQPFHTHFHYSYFRYSSWRQLDYPCTNYFFLDCNSKFFCSGFFFCKSIKKSRFDVLIAFFYIALFKYDVINVIFLRLPVWYPRHRTSTLYYTWTPAASPSAFFPTLSPPPLGLRRCSARSGMRGFRCEGGKGCFFLPFLT